MRRIDFEGSFNFRDLGGWRTDDGRTVRWRRLFRADGVHLLTQDDADRAREELGLRTLLDLRNDAEVGSGGIGLLAEAGARRHHFPLSSRRGVVVDGTVVAAASSDRGPDTMFANYVGILEASSDLIVEAVDALARDDGLPAVFFCAAGKDRTGVLSAVVLGALGVRVEDIVEDYVLSAESIDRVIKRFATTAGAPAMYRDLPSDHFAPLRETMERVVHEVRQTYGSFADYLTTKGLRVASLDSLSGALLE